MCKKPKAHLDIFERDDAVWHVLSLGALALGAIDGV